jgi:hypothetical protein
MERCLDSSGHSLRSTQPLSSARRRLEIAFDAQDGFPLLDEHLIPPDRA